MTQLYLQAGIWWFFLVTKCNQVKFSLILLTSNIAEINVMLNSIAKEGFCVNEKGKGMGRGRTVNNEEQNEKVSGESVSHVSG